MLTLPRLLPVMFTAAAAFDAERFRVSLVLPPLMAPETLAPSPRAKMFVRIPPLRFFTALNVIPNSTTRYSRH